MKTKTVPFDLETAKKIQAGEIEGRIKTRDGYDVRVLHWNRKTFSDYPLICLVTFGEFEDVYTYTSVGTHSSSRHECLDLVLEVPDNEVTTIFDTEADSIGFMMKFSNVICALIETLAQVGDGEVHYEHIGNQHIITIKE